ncbi:MAG: ferritin [Anaerolineae bacterium]|nr:ferritin [Anaerolineae bacterium]
MLRDKLQGAMNDQIKWEMYSAYLYLSMSAHFEAATLPGMARWMRLQAGEEQEHALKFYDYIHERGGRVTLQAIPQPPADFGSPKATFEEVLKHEQEVTSLITKLYELAVEEKDYAAQVMLHWFITEQVEEEKNATEIVETFKLLGESPMALMNLDRQLGTRED